ncbi:MAG: hypothetical protein KDA16_01625 [Phycisphaerales bacterium]|nr:hypothetical protein [Phycisphaerales bacterium]
MSEVDPNDPFFAGNISEAKSYIWKRDSLAMPDHQHCLICWDAISSGEGCFVAIDVPHRVVCDACHERFLSD